MLSGWPGKQEARCEPYPAHLDTPIQVSWVICYNCNACTYLSFSLMMMSVGCPPLGQFTLHGPIPSFNIGFGGVAIPKLSLVPFIKQDKCEKIFGN